MSLESWKALFEIIGVVLLGLTFLVGWGVLYFSGRINEQQAERLRNFDTQLTTAKTELATQQERAANAERGISDAKKSAADALRDAGIANQRAGEANERAGEANKKAADLEKETADARTRQAEAQKETAEAQLALRKYIDDVKKERGPRRLEFQKFVGALRGRSKAPVEILYAPNDEEALEFALQIRRWLGSGDNGDGAGWDVKEPRPIPVTGVMSASRQMCHQDSI